jgi:hypothetical protein
VFLSDENTFYDLYGWFPDAPTHDFEGDTPYKGIVTEELYMPAAGVVPAGAPGEIEPDWWSVEPIGIPPGEIPPYGSSESAVGQPPETPVQAIPTFKVTTSEPGYWWLLLGIAALVFLMPKRKD